MGSSYAPRSERSTQLSKGNLLRDYAGRQEGHWEVESNVSSYIDPRHPSEWTEPRPSRSEDLYGSQHAPYAPQDCTGTIERAPGNVRPLDGDLLRKLMQATIEQRQQREFSHDILREQVAAPRAQEKNGQSRGQHERDRGPADLHKETRGTRVRDEAGRTEEFKERGNPSSKKSSTRKGKPKSHSEARSSHSFKGIVVQGKNGEEEFIEMPNVPPVLASIIASTESRSSYNVIEDQQAAKNGRVHQRLPKEPSWRQNSRRDDKESSKTHHRAGAKEVAGHTLMSGALPSDKDSPRSLSHARRSSTRSAKASRAGVDRISKDTRSINSNLSCQASDRDSIEAESIVFSFNGDKSASRTPSKVQSESRKTDEAPSVNSFEEIGKGFCRGHPSETGSRASILIPRSGQQSDIHQQYGDWENPAASHVHSNSTRKAPYSQTSDSHRHHSKASGAKNTHQPSDYSGVYTRYGALTQRTTASHCSGFWGGDDQLQGGAYDNESPSRWKSDYPRTPSQQPSSGDWDQRTQSRIPSYDKANYQDADGLEGSSAASGRSQATENSENPMTLINDTGRPLEQMKKHTCDHETYNTPRCSPAVRTLPSDYSEDPPSRGAHSRLRQTGFRTTSETTQVRTKQTQRSRDPVREPDARQTINHEPSKIVEPHFRPATIFAGKGWITPHILSSEPPSPESKINLPSNAYPQGATMTYEEWKMMQDRGLRMHRNISTTDSSQGKTARLKDGRYTFAGWGNHSTDSHRFEAVSATEQRDGTSMPSSYHPPTVTSPHSSDRTPSVTSSYKQFNEFHQDDPAHHVHPGSTNGWHSRMQTLPSSSRSQQLGSRDAGGTSFSELEREMEVMEEGRNTWSGVSEYDGTTSDRRMSQIGSRRSGTRTTEL